jgi:hypothetical protein
MARPSSWKSPGKAFWTIRGSVPSTRWAKRPVTAFITATVPLLLLLAPQDGQPAFSRTVPRARSQSPWSVVPCPRQSLRLQCYPTTRLLRPAQLRPCAPAEGAAATPTAVLLPAPCQPGQRLLCSRPTQLVGDTQHKEHVRSWAGTHKWATRSPYCLLVAWRSAWRGYPGGGN